MKALISLLFVLIVAATPLLSSAQTIAPGDVVVGYQDFCPCGLTFHRIQIFSEDGNPKFSRSFSFPADILVSSRGTLLRPELNDLVTYSDTLTEVSRVVLGFEAAALAMN